ncbi:unnamed protein product [Protopolystoma xenopodis]|uniref:Transmembrane protein n=1 Tax=Protopolystoma xenopodis TaxID=117903 RepID=A0A3S5A6F2_9PLAT|nr:unnamed protein product [Protopolystoma xenopodis]
MASMVSVPIRWTSFNAAVHATQTGRDGKKSRQLGCAMETGWCALATVDMRPDRVPFNCIELRKITFHCTVESFRRAEEALLRASSRSASPLPGATGRCCFFTDSPTMLSPSVFSCRRHSVAPTVRGFCWSVVGLVHSPTRHLGRFLSVYLGPFACSLFILSRSLALEFSFSRSLSRFLLFSLSRFIAFLLPFSRSLVLSFYRSLVFSFYRFLALSLSRFIAFSLSRILVLSLFRFLAFSITSQLPLSSAQLRKGTGT